MANPPEKRETFFGVIKNSPLLNNPLTEKIRSPINTMIFYIKNPLFSGFATGLFIVSVVYGIWRLPKIIKEYRQKKQGRDFEL